MSHKVRHPYQILETNAFIKDDEYVFASRKKDELRISFQAIYSFGGIFKDSGNIFKNPPRPSSLDIVTIHLDGKYPDKRFYKHLSGNQNEPIFIYWYKLSQGYDWLSTYIGDANTTNLLDDYFVAVPRKQWEDDPTISDSIIERKIHAVSSVDMNWEQKINARRDNALADFFGFKK